MEVRFHVRFVLIVWLLWAMWVISDRPELKHEIRKWKFDKLENGIESSRFGVRMRKAGTGLKVQQVEDYQYVARS